MVYTPHKFAEQLPMMPECEFQALMSDVVESGLRNPIVLYNGDVLDGRNRLKACEKSGVDPIFTEFDGSESEALQFVMRENLLRRNLDPSQKAAVAANMDEILDRLADEAKMAQVEAGEKYGENHAKEVSQKIDQALDTKNANRTTSRAAAITGANRQYVHECIGIKKNYPEVFSQILSGELKVPQARKTIKKIEASRIETVEHETCAYSDIESLIESGKKFATIYADPPWKYSNQATRSSTDTQYKTMDIDEIANIPISELTEENAHLHLWTTNAFLFESREIMEAWGFEYKSCFIWAKPQIGMGNYWRLAHEFLLLGIKGSCPFLDRSQRSWQEISRCKHSKKPEEIARTIEKVSPGPYLELFGRETRQNWVVWGNEIKRALFNESAFK